MIYCLFEEKTRDFLPLVHLRPVMDLLCGAMTLREKWEKALGRGEYFVAVRDELHEYRERPDLLRRSRPGVGRGVWFVNARYLPEGDLLKAVRREPSTPRLLVSGDTVVAAYLRSGDAGRVFTGRSAGLPDFSQIPGIRREEIAVRGCADFWDLIRLNPEQIARDRALLGRRLRPPGPAMRKGAHLAKGAGIYAGARTVIKPGAVIDAENGPVLLGDDVTIMPNAVIIGPAVVGNGAIVKAGARLYGGTTIGARSKAGGEIEGSVMLPFVNKQHEGFLGHSYLASWVNLGADTNTSDLKNTYGPVSILRRGKKLDTGMQFLGLTMGDHSKSGINVMFDTGTVAGVCCNIFGAGLPPKEIPSFTWSGPGGAAVYDPARGFEVMKIVMARRGVTPTPEYARTVREVFERTSSDRDIAGIR